jgi:hypothetical protein
MGLALVWVGSIIYLVGVIWLVYLAWANSQPLMAVGVFCLAPIFGTIYGIQNFDEAKIPLGIMWGGFILRLVAFAIPST